MSHGRTKYYEVYREAEKINLEEIVWLEEETGNPSLKVTVSIDGSTIENVTFRRDILSRAYAMPPETEADTGTAVTILFGGEVQVILDRFAEFILPAMKPLGLNPFTGDKILDPMERASSDEIRATQQKINAHRFIWKKQSCLPYNSD